MISNIITLNSKNLQSECVSMCFNDVSRLNNEVEQWN